MGAAVAGIASKRISANVAVLGAMTVPVTWTQMPFATVTSLLRFELSCCPPPQSLAPYHATRTWAVVRRVPVGTKIQPLHVYETFGVIWIRSPPRHSPPPLIPLAVVESAFVTTRTAKLPVWTGPVVMYPRPPPCEG